MVAPSHSQILTDQKVMVMMDVNVDIQGGESFSIQLRSSQTIRDIKEKVQDLRQIPIRQQIILHNQQLLYDDLKLHECFIQNGSRIIVQILDDAPIPVFSPNDSDFDPGSSSPEPYSDLPPSRAQVPDLNLTPSPALEADPSPAPLHDLNLPPVPSPSPSQSPAPLQQSYLPPVPCPTLGSNLTPQPTSDLQLPTLFNKGYNRSDILQWNPSLQLIQASNEDDLLEVGGFSSSPLLMSMPSTPSRVRTAAESAPLPPPYPWWLPPLPPALFQNIPNPVPPPPATVTLNVKVPQSRDRVRIESERTDTVRELKEKIVALEDMQGVTVDRIVLQLHSLRLELLDHVALRDCAVSENSQIDVLLKPAVEESGSNEEQFRKLKVTVLPMRTNERIEIEVFSFDKVSVLRQKLDELHQMQGFLLPEDGGYFFIYGRQGMHEEQSFDWHRVRDGDTIQTFDGFLTRNSSPTPSLTLSPTLSPSSLPSLPSSPS